jgi:hypothetical protein
VTLGKKSRANIERNPNDLEEAMDAAVDLAVGERMLWLPPHISLPGERRPHSLSR